MRYADRGLRILAFPCNQFGGMEPGSDDEILRHARDHLAEYHLFSKIHVNGIYESLLFKFLKEKLPGTFTNDIKWNFSKFLCDKNGIPVKRYSPSTQPSTCRGDIELELVKEM